MPAVGVVSETHPPSQTNAILDLAAPSSIDQRG
eukprot:COSAG04_NODE_17230_length_475_cov_1.026596_1_plen_32_part_10